MKKLLVVLLICVVFAGCSSVNGEAEPRLDEPLNEGTSGEDGNEASPSFGLTFKDNYVVINKNLLASDFLMMPTLVERSSTFTMPAVFTTKIVYFEKIGEKLYLMENIEGQIVSDPYMPAKILAEFPIISENFKEIVFDFKAGLDAIIINSASLYEGGANDSIVPAASYIENFISDENYFSLNHVAQVVWLGEFVTVNFNYGFIPEQRSLLSELLPDEEGRYGFFVTMPEYERTTGKTTNAVHRWDISKPILFYISANTPEEYRDVIKEGVLAWNDVFGKEVLKVDIAPEGVVMGDPRYSMIQWIGDDNAEMALAAWHSHPRTGEIIRANVIFPSMWVVSGKKEARRLLAVLNNRDDSNEIMEREQIGLAGFERQYLCNIDFTSVHRDFLKRVALREIPENRILDLSKLLIRAIIMHEIGHDLGLRHNFYGNLGSEIPLESEKESLRKILENGLTDGAPLPSSSVMDYQAFENEILMHHPGLYDVMAIRWAYGLGESRGPVPLLCMDEDLGQNLDCDTFDGGADPVLWRGTKLVDEIIYLSKWLEERFLNGDEEIEEDFYDPARIMMSYMVGLKNYLNIGNEILEIAPLSADERRANASMILSEYLKASDANYNALGKMITPDLAEKLFSSSDIRGKDEAFGYLTGVRDFYVGGLLSYLSSLLLRDAFGPPIILTGEPSANRSEEIAAESANYRMTSFPDAVRPMAEALGTIAANHINLTSPSEPHEYRLTSARLLSALERESIHDIIADVVLKIENNISALQQAMNNLASEKERAQYEDLIDDEIEILNLLSGTVAPIPIVNNQ